MPHALLLSPDDQAVSAITGVLEELSVTCERPLDGVSAAQKLNSQTFDLVLVDCENLPAAKLIFDVCRRGKNGNNPVPIAIVDGRAGLPTAFRLGAELILTKPVSKDQARTTIRTAVGRVRKDVTPVESTAPQVAIAPAPVATVANITVPEKASLAMAASASSQLTSFEDAVPKFAPAAVSAPATEPATSLATRSVGALFSSSVTQSTELFEAPMKHALPEPTPAKAPFIPSDDPVLAELERTEIEDSKSSPLELAAVPPKVVAELTAPKSEEPVLSSYGPAQSKGHGVFVALLMLVVAGGGFYAAWMYQPGFRALAQPQVDRVLALAGMSVPVSPKSNPTQPPPQQSAPPVQAVVPVPAPVPADDLSKASAVAPESTAAPSTGANQAIEPTTSPAVGTQAAPASAPVAPPVSATPISAVPTVAQPVGKPEISKPVQSKVKEAKKDAIAAAPADAPLPGENNAVILSSKGAEKRLAHSVAPKYPADVRSDAIEGTVVLKEVVDEDGNVKGVRLVEGNAALANAAMQAVKQWRYRPYVRDGKAQPFQTVVIVDFQKP